MRRAVGAAVVAVLTAALLVSTSPAMAAPEDDKRRVDRQLRQVAAQLDASEAALARAQKQLAVVAAKLPAAERAAAKARGALVAARVRRDIAKQQGVVARAESAAAGVQYLQAQADVEESRRQLDGFVSDAYQGGGANVLGAMLDAKSPSELAVQIATLRYVARGKDVAVRRIEVTRLRSAQHRADAAWKRQLADQAASAADKAFAASQAAEAASTRAEAEIVRLVGMRKGALATAQRQRAAETARYAELQRQSRSIAAILRAASAADRRGGNTGSAGPLMRPVSAPITSHFGYRFHPIYKVWRLHAGTDFGAPGGTPIVAAGSGVVVRAGYSGGYGNYTCISHGQASGRGLATCYAHQSSILVGYGQRVSRSQRIGRVGTTGASTGNHLHFEVRLDGQPVNPMSWI